MTRIWKSGGPIVMSALSLFICFALLQPYALWISPDYTLLASRSVGKFAFITLVIYQIILFMLTRSASFIDLFFKTNVSFFRNSKWMKLFGLFFAIFFCLHAITLVKYCMIGYGQFQWPVLPKLGTLTLRFIVGIIATFLLAWTEELIFRGTLYQYCAQFFTPLTSALVTSTIFSLSHNLSSPLTLICSEWRLGLGLFLLGLFLNLIFIITKKLYAGMGAHAGLVFVKVFLRRIPLIVFATPSAWNWWLAADLRQAHGVHLMFVLVNVGMIWWWWDQMVTQPPGGSSRIS